MPVFLAVTGSAGSFISKESCPHMVKDGQKHGGEHISHGKFFPEGYIDPHTEDQRGAHVGNAADHFLTHDISEGGRHAGDGALVEEKGQSGKNHSLSHGGGEDDHDHKVQNGFGGQGGVISGETVLDGSHNGHGSNADDKGAGHKPFHKMSVALRVKFSLQKFAQLFDAVFNVQKISDETPHNQ